MFFRGIMVTDYITDSVPVIEEPFGLNVKIADPERLLMTYLPTSDYQRRACILQKSENYWAHYTLSQNSQIS
jgi:hypothetical protein